MRGRVPGLGGPEPNLFHCFFAVREEHPTTTGGDDLIPIEPSASYHVKRYIWSLIVKLYYLLRYI
jgi:hypothetical protein